MGLARSTYYDAPSRQADDAEIVATMIAICDEFEVYGYRRVGAALPHRGLIVNSKKVRRLMRDHNLQPKRRRRFVATTHSNHDGLIFPDLTRDTVVDGPNQIWVADITRGLQHTQAPLGARVPEPHTVRGLPRPADGQNRRVILSGFRGALH
jgi:putative transposase